MRWALHLRSAATAGVIGSAGDALMQWQERASSSVDGTTSSIDAARSARVATFRAVQAPIIDSAWRFFDARLLARGGALAAGVRGAAARALCDQCLLAPPSIAAFFLTQSAFEGLSAAESVERARTSFADAYAVAFPFWSCIHMVTFGLIRPDWRIAWSSFIAVFWNAFMSGQNQEARTRERAGAAVSATGKGAEDSVGGEG